MSCGSAAEELVVHGEVVSDGPPLRSLGNPALPNNLPAELSVFIGRGREVAEVRALSEALSWPYGTSGPAFPEVLAARAFPEPVVLGSH